MPPARHKARLAWHTRARRTAHHGQAEGVLVRGLAADVGHGELAHVAPGLHARTTTCTCHGLAARAAACHTDSRRTQSSHVVGGVADAVVVGLAGLEARHGHVAEDRRGVREPPLGDVAVRALVHDVVLGPGGVLGEAVGGRAVLRARRSGTKGRFLPLRQHCRRCPRESIVRRRTCTTAWTALGSHDGVEGPGPSSASPTAQETSTVVSSHSVMCSCSGLMPTTFFRMRDPNLEHVPVPA